MNGNDGDMPLSEFMRLSDEEVSVIVRRNGAPTSVCVVDDATRRTGQVFFGLDVTDPDFIQKLNRRLSRPYQRIFSSCFRQGADTLFVPAMTYGCYSRGDVYHHKIMEFAQEVFTGDYWMGYFHDEDIRLSQALTRMWSALTRQPQELVPFSLALDWTGKNQAIQTLRVDSGALVNALQEQIHAIAAEIHGG